MINRPYDSQELKKKKMIAVFLGIFLILSNIYYLIKKPIVVAYLFYFVWLLYLFGCVLSYIVYRRRSKFKCLMCGECCKLKVNITKQEIKIIEKLGFKRKYFTKDNRSLKKVNGYCVFLRKRRGKMVCGIYKHRPPICRKWPFFSHPFSIPLLWIFRCVSLKNLILNKSS